MDDSEDPWELETLPGLPDGENTPAPMKALATQFKIGVSKQHLPLSVENKTLYVYKYIYLFMKSYEPSHLHPPTVPAVVFNRLRNPSKISCLGNLGKLQRLAAKGLKGRWLMFWVISHNLMTKLWHTQHLGNSEYRKMQFKPVCGEFSSPMSRVSSKYRVKSLHSGNVKRKAESP